MTSDIAHDFNNPLTVVLGNTELLLNELAHQAVRSGRPRNLDHELHCCSEYPCSRLHD